MITDIVRQVDAPAPIVSMVIEIYDYTPATLHLHGRELRIHPRRGMKEGAPYQRRYSSCTTTSSYGKPSTGNQTPTSMFLLTTSPSEPPI